MTLLVLGGTRDAKLFAGSLHSQGIALIYSVADILPGPDLSFPMHRGGFSRFGPDSVSGLVRYIHDQQITAIADLTHPYAAAMSRHAQSASRQAGIPCWRYQRPAWRPVAGDQWLTLADEGALLTRLQPFSRPLFTIGRSAYALLDRQPTHQHWTIRSGQPAVSHDRSRNLTHVQALGPFSLSDERDLLQQHRIDCLIAKQSGGPATEAKLIAARGAGLPVLFLQRPRLPEVSREFDDLDTFIRFFSQHRLDHRQGRCNGTHS